jgi:hypothetical protein
MVPSHASSDSSETDEPVYPHAMASSLAGLPVRPQGAQNGTAEDDQESTTAASNGAKAQSGQLKDFLDLAVRWKVGEQRAFATEACRFGSVGWPGLIPYTFCRPLAPALPPTSALYVASAPLGASAACAKPLTKYPHLTASRAEAP